MSILTASDTTFKNVIKKEGVTLVDFSGQWCPPCKALLPILDELHREYQELSILKVDCDESPLTAGEFGIMSTPTVIVFHDGEPIEKIIGLRPKEVYQSVLDRYIK